MWRRYKDGKRWNGIIYNRNMEYKSELKFGNGYIKEFNENGCIIFEGDIKNGDKTGKRKISDECGDLIFEGNLEKGIKIGKGKIYNYSGDLIFDGEFKNGKQFKGKINENNEQCELINKKEEGKENTFQTIITYDCDIMISDCIYIMKKKIIEITDRFEGGYKDGKKYKGKEYYHDGKLIFESEYKDGKKWNGKFYIDNNNESGNIINGNGINIKVYNKYGKLKFEGEYKNRKNIKEKNIIMMVH